MTSPKVAGAVLCGGRSTRMGRDKATLVVDGEAMAVSASTALVAGGCDRVIAVGGEAGALTALGLVVVSDAHPAEGPLGGILTALDALGGFDVVVVVSCDMRWLTAATVSAVVAGLGDHDVAVACGTRREPLCAAWRTSCVAVVRTCFDGGERAVHRAIAACSAIDVDVDPTSVRNVNAPADVYRTARGHDG